MKETVVENVKAFANRMKPTPQTLKVAGIAIGVTAVVVAGVYVASKVKASRQVVQVVEATFQEAAEAVAAAA